MMFSRQTAPLKGVMIALEGLDGSGKSTQAELLGQKMREKGYDVVVTRDSGGTDLGEQLRGIMQINRSNKSLDERADLMLVLASRAQLVAKVILPALERGAIVVSDRFIDSSIAIQGGLYRLGHDLVYQLCMVSTQGIVPDATLFIDTPIEECARRIRSARNTDWPDHFDIAYLAGLHTQYMQWKQRAPYRFFAYNGAIDKTLLTNNLCASIESIYNSKKVNG